LALMIEQSIVQTSELASATPGAEKFLAWGGLPYYPISKHYQKIFGEKVFKVPVSVAQSCPNRDGLKGMKTCIFCDVWGSAAYPDLREETLFDQIQKGMHRVKRRTNAEKFMVYFQAYTNTFSKTADIRKLFETAINYPGVIGFVIGTRPDCISDAVLDLWAEYSEKTFIAVELGAQSFDNKQLEWMKRGHTHEQTLKAVERIKANAPVDLGLHLIFGWPDETDADIVSAAKEISTLSVDNVKLHNLHVLKNTELETIYQAGNFRPLELDEYAKNVVLFLQHTRPNLPVHRLAALASRADELIAPAWVGNKMFVYQEIINEFKRQNAYQGQLYV